MPIRLMAGLHYLKRLKGLSDEQVLRAWVENPYMQFFCGEEFFQHRLPIDPSQVSRWRQRIGADGVEKQKFKRARKVLRSLKSLASDSAKTLRVDLYVS